jgi:hypothetical protein
LHLLDGQVHHDTHVIPMGNYVIEAGNYMIVNPSELGNYKIADSNQPPACAKVAEKPQVSTSICKRT